MKTAVLLSVLVLILLMPNALARFKDATDPDAIFLYRTRFDTNYNSTSDISPIAFNGTDGLDLSSLVIETNCDDLRITTDDTETPLAFELPNSSDPIFGCGQFTEMWLNSSLTTDNLTVFAYHGTESDIPNNSTTIIWDSDYLAIYHFGNEPFENNSIGNASTDLNISTGNRSAANNQLNSLFGNSRVFVGGNNGGLFANDPDNGLTSSGNFTIEAWVNVTGGGGSRYIISRVAGGNTEYILFVASAGTLSCEMDTGSGLRNTFSTTNLDSNLDQWFYVACVYNGTHIGLYVNGILEGNTATTGSLLGESRLFSVGSRNDNIENFNGAIDEVRISNITRDQAYIDAVYNARLTNRVILNNAANSSCITGYTVCGGKDARYGLLCADDDGDGDIEWSRHNRTFCSAGCNDGVCNAETIACVNQCNVTTDQKICGGSQTKFLFNCTTNLDGCNIWNPDNRTFCPFGCSPNGCLNGTDVCFSGTSRCFGRQIVTCRDIDNDGFTEWDTGSAEVCTNECFVDINQSTGTQFAFCEFGSGNLTVIYGIRKAIDTMGIDLTTIFFNEAWRTGFIMAFIVVMWGLVTWISTWELGAITSIGISSMGMFMGWVPLYIGILFIFISGLLLFFGNKVGD